VSTVRGDSLVVNELSAYTFSTDGTRCGVSRDDDKNAVLTKICISKYIFALKSPRCT